MPIFLYVNLNCSGHKISTSSKVMSKAYLSPPRVQFETSEAYLRHFRQIQYAGSIQPLMFEILLTLYTLHNALNFFENSQPLMSPVSKS